MRTLFNFLSSACFATTLIGCQQPKPKTTVDVMNDGAVVDVQSKKSDVYVGEEGIKVNSKKTQIDIGKEGIRILGW